MFRRYATTNNIAQIVLIVILLPFVAIVFSVLSGGSGGSFSQFALSLFNQIPLCDVWLDVLTQTSGVTQQGVVSSVPVVILRSVPEALILAISVYACNQTYRVLLHGRGMAIFSTFCGVLLGTALTALTGRIPNLAAELGVNVIMIIGLVIMMRAVFGRRRRSIFGVRRILVIIADAALGCIASAYVCMFLIVSHGYYASAGKAFASFLTITLIFMAAAVLRYVISLDEDSYL